MSPRKQTLLLNDPDYQSVFMPERNNKLQPAPVTEVHPNPAPTSPFNYSIDEEAEREKAMDRANDKVPNNPARPIL